MDEPALPDCGVALDGRDAVRDASTEQWLAWLRALKIGERELREVEQLDRGLRDVQLVVLRYGLLKALIEKGYDVPRDAAQWQAFDAAMRARLG
ncbi:MAG TPA: hypothetical protein VGR28_00375 [Candidatus Thermoplasmatota archaeon]|nr:hypothetical protein [Candidatus Thermoplasmatota archaeon]